MKNLAAREHAKIIDASSQTSAQGWEQFNAALITDARNDLVLVEWGVDYDKLGHDIIIHAKVKVVDHGDALLQAWLKDQHPGIWIPEFRPWVASVVEFSAEDNIRNVQIGLYDSKWRKEDANETYTALLWGYLMHNGVVEKFAFTKSFVYPG